MGDSDMKLEVGKYYKTRDGRKVSVMSIMSGIAKMSDGGHLFEGNGKLFMGDKETDSDVVSLWGDSPVREVMRREIVPGTYGRIVVDGASNGTVKLTFKYKTIPPEFTAEELDSAAMVFSQLAEALRDG